MIVGRQISQYRDVCNRSTGNVAAVSEPRATVIARRFSMIDGRCTDVRLPPGPLASDKRPLTSHQG